MSTPFMDNFLTIWQTIWISLQRGELPQLGYWTYLVLALLIVLQGPLMTLLGAAAAATGLLQLHLVFLVGIVGNLTADALWYLVGRAGKLHWFLALTNAEKRPVTAQKIDALQTGMQTNAPRFVLAAKLSVGFVVPTLIAVGLARVPWKRWFPMAFLGETLWTGGLALLGYFAAATLSQLSANVRLFSLGVSALFLIGAIWLARRYWQQEMFDKATK